MIPGEYLLESADLTLNAGRRTVTIAVTNRGDRPIQVGSHCHFFEVNRWLAFERAKALGMRLDIAAGTAVRFEPGDSREVGLVQLGGSREVIGFNRLVEGAVDEDAVRRRALEHVRQFSGDRPPSRGSQKAPRR